MSSFIGKKNKRGISILYPIRKRKLPSILNVIFLLAFLMLAFGYPSFGKKLHQEILNNNRDSGESIFNPIEQVGYQTFYPSPFTDDSLYADQQSENPNHFRLEQNYPNPFNPVTQIIYTIPQNAHVVLKVYDMMGREVKSVVDRYQVKGRYRVNFHAGNLTSGMYLYRLKAGDYVKIRKMVLIK